MDRKRLSSDDTHNTDGHRLFRAALGTLASFIVLLLASSSASAATLDVSGGQLLGASGVDVGGTLYNVEFLDGTCIALYNGCDDVSDFTFQTEVAAVLAAQALLDQVFLDVIAGNFLTDYGLTTGCETEVTGGFCAASTPYLVNATPYVYEVSAYIPPPTDVSQGAFTRVADLSTSSSQVYAVWSPVPEPGTGAMMGLGLLGLSVSNRRQR